MSSHTLVSSPLQGFTDYRFRNAIDKYFGGIDIYYAPYIRLNGKLAIKSVYQKDLDPKHNRNMPIIPQVMTCQVEEFLFVINYVQSLGYNEINWNLGCPYPMVINRGMGSGLIADPDRIERILDEVHSKTDITVSMKMRMGYANNSEILDAFPVLAKFPIKNIGIHARIGAQLYEGGVDLDGFQRCLDHSPHPVYYNGDITTVERFREMVDRFPTLDHWMIGRGLIMDPFLPQMIKDDTMEYPEDRIDVFSKFHDRLMSEYIGKLSGDKHVIMKMTSFWEYFVEAFDSNKKLIKQIKKAKTIDIYDEVVADFMAQQRASQPYY